MRELILLGLLAVAGLLVVIGVAQWSGAVAFIVAGVLLAALALFGVREVPEPVETL